MWRGRKDQKTIVKKERKTLENNRDITRKPSKISKPGEQIAYRNPNWNQAKTKQNH